MRGWGGTLGRTTARVIAYLWAFFWIGFGLLSGPAEGLDLAGTVVHALIPGGLFLLVALAATRWPSQSGALLLLTSAAVISAGYTMIVGERSSIGALILTMLLLAGPPLVAGLVLLRTGSSRVTAHGPLTG